MPRQTVPIQFGPLAQKSPSQTGTTGTLKTVQNLVALKGDNDGLEFWPRPGVSAVSKTADSGTISAGKRLSTLGSALLLQDGNNIWRNASDKWHFVSANAPILSVASVSMCANTLSVGSADSVYVNGYTVSVYTTHPGFSDGQVNVLVTDAAGAPVINVTLDTGNVGTARVVASGNFAIVAYAITANTIKAWKLDTTNIVYPPSAPVTVTTTAAFGVGAGLDIQAIAATGTLAISYLSSATSTYHLIKLTASTMAVSGDTNTTIAGVQCFSLATNDWSTTEIFAAWGAQGTGISVTKFNGTTFATVTTTVYDASIVWVTSLAANRTGSTVTVVGTTTPSGTFVATNQTDYRIIKTTGGASVTVMRGIQLASRVLPANGTLYVLAQYPGSGQGTYFLLDLNVSGLSRGTAVGKCLQNSAPQTVVTSLPNLAAGPSATVWQTACLRNVAAATTATGLAAYVGASAVTFTVLDSSVGRGVEVNGGCHFPGAMPWLYDGQVLVEEGLANAPEQVDNIVQTTGGLMTAGATYTVRVVYAWTDAAGNLHRSGPTLVPQQIVMTGSNTRMSFDVPTLRNSLKSGVSIEVYMSVANGDGSVLYNIIPFGSPLLNDQTADRINCSVNLSDAQIVTGEPLYTDGGVLDNLPPPPCKSFVAHKGRLMAAGIDTDTQAIWFSKDVEPGFGVAFNDGLVSRLQVASDPITSIISMDSFAVACTQGGTTWASSDQYPDDLLNGGVLNFAEYSTNVGCTATGLMARTDDGVTMWGGAAATTGNVPPKSIWRMSRGLAFDYIGSAVEADATGFTPVAVVAVPSQNQIRIIGTDAGGVSAALVYESIFKTWATWRYTQQATAIVDAILWRGVVAYLCADGTVLTENAAGYDDLGVAGSVPHVLSVIPVNLAGVSGFKRIYVGQWTGLVLGTGGFTARIDQAIDGVAQTRKTFAITAADTQLNIEFDPGTAGKCSDYGVTFSDAGNGANTAFTLAALTLDVMIKPNADRLPPSRRAT